MNDWGLTIARFLKLSRPLLLELRPSFPAAEMMDICLDTGLALSIQMQLVANEIDGMKHT